MNKDIIAGDWKIVKGRIKQAWGRLSDDQIDESQGNMDILEGQIQKTYGFSEDEAKRRLKEWNRKNKESEDKSTGKVKRTPDGTIEENVEEQAP